MFEGNIRQVTFVNGGDNVIPHSQRGTLRSSLISNLDWSMFNLFIYMHHFDDTKFEETKTN